MGALTIGIGMTLQSLIGVVAIWFFLGGAVFSLVLTILLYNIRGTQSIRELLIAEDKDSPKPQNEGH
jgi:hypothetical protein